jgi:hypothetical protein
MDFIRDVEMLVERVFLLSAVVKSVFVQKNSFYLSKKNKRIFLFFTTNKRK